MASEPEKSPEHQQPPTSAPPTALYLHPSAFTYAAPPGQAGTAPPAPWPPGMYPPTVLPYPPTVPPVDGTDATVAPIGYVMIPPPPPGMVYAFPPLLPGQSYHYAPPSMPVPAPETAEPPKPKRKQVRQACSNCAAACKRCDDSRPCARCEKYGIAESCADAVRKERQKGVKRGPYKRRAKESEQSTDQQPSTDWLPAPLEGYPQPYFYPPAPNFFPVPAASDANGVTTPSTPDAASVAHPPPATPYYPLPPMPYPAFHSYPPPSFMQSPVPPSRVETAKDESEKKKRKAKKKAGGPPAEVSVATDAALS